MTFQYKTDLKIMTFQFSGAATGRYEQTRFKSRGDYCRYSALTVMNVEEDNESLLAVQKEHDKLCSERTAYKKEADRLSRLARQKRDSQKTIQRYLQNEQAAKRKKNQLE